MHDKITFGAGSHLTALFHFISLIFFFPSTAAHGSPVFMSCSAPARPVCITLQRKVFTKYDKTSCKRCTKILYHIILIVTS